MNRVLIALLLGLAAPLLSESVAGQTVTLPPGSRVGTVHRDASGEIRSNNDPAAAQTVSPQTVSPQTPGPVPQGPTKPAAAASPPAAQSAQSRPPAARPSAAPGVMANKPADWDGASCHVLAWQLGFKEDSCRHELAAVRSRVKGGGAATPPSE